VLCRPALPADRARVLHFLSEIWGGDDYVPQVWDDWLNDRAGVLATGVVNGHPAGMGRLADFGFGEWWLEGLRVDPARQGLGIGSAVHRYLIGAWERSPGSQLRLTTHRQNVAVHRMCERTGLEPTISLLDFRAPARPGQTDFQPWRGSPRAVLDATRHLPSVTGSGGMIDLGWRFAVLRPERWLDQVAVGNVWEWRGGPSWVILAPPSELEGSATIAAAAIPVASGSTFLGDVRRLAHGRGFPEIHWLAPAEPRVRRVLEEAGFRATEDDLLMFERHR
jgi:GNAT superfamily N-acetyltransferase